MPGSGPLPVDVPGVVSGWDALLARFGTISMAQALGPAIGFARDGFPVAELMAVEWQASVERLTADPAAARTFLPNGTAPVMGEIFANPRLARSLELIARDGKDAFYAGPIAQAIAADMQARDGLLTAQDLADHTADWVETISTSYRGVDVHEMPPSTQGIVALEMLNILEGFDIAAMGHNSADCLHVVAEAKKIAFADRGAWLADRAFMPGPVLTTLLSKAYAAARRAEIDLTKAGTYAAGALAAGPPRPPTSPIATAATRSTSAPPTARATSSRSSSRSSPASAPASSPATPASRCTTAAPASRSSPAIPTRSARASGHCTRWCRRCC